MKPLIDIQNLTIKYGNVTVIDDISFQIHDTILPGRTTGQICAFLGSSGCGKSTLFKAIAGLKSFEGHIGLATVESGEIVDYVAPKPGLVGLVDQKYTMFRHKTVRQTLTAVLNRNKKIAKKLTDNVIEEFSTELGINHVLDKYPNEISGGQRQRSALLERLFNGNNFIILDEPFSGLDVKSKNAAKRFIREIVNKEQLNTMIFCTHNVKAAVEMADVIIILDKTGKIIKNVNLRAIGLEYDSYTAAHINLEHEITNLLS
jgi:ABC-type sugar transport system ATPase subunit